MLLTALPPIGGRGYLKEYMKKLLIFLVLLSGCCGKNKVKVRQYCGYNAPEYCYKVITPCNIA
jgi:hypothetical protein